MAVEGSAAAVAAACLPGVESLAFLADADEAVLSPSDLVDAVIASERLLAAVNAHQSRMLAELGKPGRCGDITRLIDALVDKGGKGRNTDGEVDAAVVDDETARRAVSVAASEVAAMLDWSAITAGIRIRQAQRLKDDLPQTFRALSHGRVDVGRVRMIIDRTAVLDAPTVGSIESRILAAVKGRSKGQLETLVDREVIKADPEAAEKRRKKANADRRVDHRVDKDGMGVINALLPAEAAVMVFTLVDVIADANKGLDDRTVDQRRADAIADIADELLTHGYVDLQGLVARAEQAQNAGETVETDCAATKDEDVTDEADADATTGDGDPVESPAGPTAGGAPAEPGSAEPGSAEPGDDCADTTTATGDSDGFDAKVERLRRAMSRHGRRPHLVVTGAWTTLAGLDDLPGELDGHGTITAQLLRQIAASWGSVTAVGVNPSTGTATAVGGTAYRPTQRVSDQVILLSGTCRVAGCRMAAWKCELDHVDPYNHTDPDAGGQSTLEGLLPACKWHHLLKHHTSWTPHLRADLSVVWTTNTGHRATSHPRSFTLPGEWSRGADDPKTRFAATTSDPGDKSVLSPDVGPSVVVDPDIVDPDVVDPAFVVDPVVGVGPATVDPATVDPVVVDPDVMVGPVVAGPTIPIPLPPDYEEPHTELEDPDTVPHPGSVEIHTYRLLRQQARETSLRRIRRLTALRPTALNPTVSAAMKN